MRTLLEKLAVQVGAVDHAVADGAVLEARLSLVVKHRGVGVTLEAQEPHLGPRQHFRNRAPMRLMAACAAGNTPGRMLEQERPSASFAAAPVSISLPASQPTVEVAVT